MGEIKKTVNYQDLTDAIMVTLMQQISAVNQLEAARKSKKPIHIIRSLEKRIPRTVPVIIGNCGIGKSWLATALVEDLMEEYFKGNIINIRVSEMPEGELGGLPDVHRITEDGKTYYSKPSWFRSDLVNEWVLVFLDEINRGEKGDPTQQMLHKFLNERSIHEWKLPDRWIILAACNPEGTGDYQVTDLMSDKSMSTRLKKYPLDMPLEDFVLWAGKQDALGRQNIHGSVLEFFVQNPDEFERDDNCPRTIHEFSDSLYFLEEIDRLELFVTQAAASLDIGTAVALSTFYNNTGIELKAIDILEYKKKTANTVAQLVKGQRNDVLLQVIDSLATTVSGEKLNDHVENIFTFLKQIPVELTYKFFKELLLRVHKNKDFQEYFYKLYSSAGDDTELYSIISDISEDKKVAFDSETGF